MKNFLKGVAVVSVFLIAIIWVYPLLLILFNSFKPYTLMMSEFLSLPKNLPLITYVEAWQKLEYAKLFFNTFIYTFFSVIIIVISASMAAFKLSRTKSRLSGFLFMFCLAPLMIPFQSYMITATQFAKKFGMMGNRIGVIVVSAGLCMPLATFLYHGFMKTIPSYLDESARIDGASGLTLFFKIIFPLLKPVTTTIVVIDTLAIWNDFLVPLLYIGGKSKYYNIQTALYAQFSNSYSDWEHALPGIIISLVPTIIFFIIMQKHIVDGVTAGAIK